jgi:hypothetical protein
VKTACLSSRTPAGRHIDITNNVKQTFVLNSTDLKDSSALSLHRHHEIHVSLLYEAFLALIDIGFNKRILGIADGDGFRSSFHKGVVSK